MVEYWSNNSDDRTLAADTFAQCNVACEQTVDCMQWLFKEHENICSLSLKKVQLGERYLGGEGEKFNSGWNKGRIGEWILQQTKENGTKMGAALLTTG